MKEIITSLLTGFAERGLLQSISIETELATIPKVHVDRELMEMILENLIDNAFAAMPEGGRLTVSTSLKHSSTGDYIVIRVQDTGVGIAPAHIPLVFEPLYTTKTGADRPGLGLASTKKIVEAIGGSIGVQSKPGEGTVFTMVLPAEQQTSVDFSI